MVNEVMGQMAVLLPEKMRGAYTECAKSECKYL
jgi:hypothetical protein